MQFIGTQGEVLRCLDMVDKAVATRDTNPILTGIYMRCEDGLLTLRATDTEIGMEAYTKVESVQPGSVVIEAKHFVPLVRRLPPGEIVFKELQEQQMLEITAGCGNFRLQTMVADQFPSLTVAEQQPLLQIPGQLLGKMIRQTVYAARREQGHSVFAGVLMEYVDGELRLVATDTSRLCFNRQSLPGETNFSLILPARTCTELQRILPSDSESMVELALMGNQAVFKLEDIVLVSRLLEGQYPDYNRVIPASTETEVIVSCQELSAALERANLMSKKAPAIVTFDVQEGILRLESRDVELGESEESLSIEQNGPMVKSAFQARFLLDMLKTIGTDQAKIGVSSGLNPGTIRPADSDDYIYVVMPVRTP
ncbi:MAG: DNA polymerase III subunit beta [Firmicutes bacterium]|nr:DNA polymerase III subunit beta [Bacillota bacterium]